MSIGRLIIDSDDRSEGTSESTGGSGCEALNDSSGPEVLTFLAGGHNTKLLGREVVAPGVVGGLLISYLRWIAREEGLVGAPPSKGGIRRAFVA